MTMVLNNHRCLFEKNYKSVISVISNSSLNCSDVKILSTPIFYGMSAFPSAVNSELKNIAGCKRKPLRYKLNDMVVVSISQLLIYSPVVVVSKEINKGGT